MSYRPQVAVDDPKARAAFTIYSTLLGGSMGSRLFDEIREQRGLCYSVYATDHAYADVPVLQLGAGLESSKCAEAYTRMREIVAELAADGPTAEEVERARAYAAGRRVLAFENTNAVARYAANQRIVFGEDIDPDAAIALLDAVTFDDVVEAARTVDPEELAVACVGPHESGEFCSLVKALRRAASAVRSECSGAGGRGPQPARADPLRLARERPMAAVAGDAGRGARRRRPRRGAAA